MVSNEGREPIESVGEFIVEKYKRNEISPKYHFVPFKLTLVY